MGKKNKGKKTSKGTEEPADAKDSSPASPGDTSAADQATQEPAQSQSQEQHDGPQVTQESSSAIVTDDTGPTDASTLNGAGEIERSQPAGASDVQAENDRLREEVAALKQRLESKDMEIKTLKAQVNGSLNNQAAAPGSSTEDLDALQSRLSELKVQQQEADEQRERAWKALKQAIEEVSTLAKSTAQPVN